MVLTVYPYLGNVYIGDRNNHRIRKVTVSTGIITTVAGSGSTTFTGDNGPATSAALYYPSYVALDSAGNLLFGSKNIFFSLNIYLFTPPR